MAFKLYSDVREVSTTGGTGDQVLTGSAFDTSYVRFNDRYSDADTFFYRMKQPGVGWEIGKGTRVASGDKITRTQVYKSSNSNSLVNFTNGVTIDIFVTNIAPSDLDDAGRALLLANMGIAVPRGHIAGLTLSTAGSSATFSVAAGQASDSTSVDTLNLAASISKTTSAWAVGSTNGGLDTGSIANSTFYHVYLIKRPDTGVVDVLFSTSASSPTMPTNYTLKRRIGTIFTNGSAQWVSFRQVGDRFYWVTPLQDVNDAALSTTDNQYGLTVPLGIAVIALIRGYITAGALRFVLIHSGADGAMTANASPVGNFNVGMEAISNFPGYELQVPTDTAQHIRAVSTGASTNLVVVTYGWIDPRGKDD